MSQLQLKSDPGAFTVCKAIRFAALTGVLLSMAIGKTAIAAQDGCPPRVALAQLTKCLDASNASLSGSREKSTIALFVCQRSADALDECSRAANPDEHQLLGWMLGWTAWEMGVQHRHLGDDSTALKYYARGRLLLDQVLAGQSNPNNIKGQVRVTRSKLEQDLESYQKELGVR